MSKIFLIFIFSSISIYLKSQCITCESTTKAIFNEIENNYVKSKYLSNSNSYNSFKKNILKSSSRILDSDSCFINLVAIKYFLKDNHISFNRKDSNMEKISSIKLSSLIIESKKSKSTNSMIGIWIDSIASMKYLICKSSDLSQVGEYIAVVIQSDNPKWKFGDIRAKFFKKNGIIMKNSFGVSSFIKYQYTGNILKIHPRVVWKKENTRTEQFYYNLKQKISKINTNTILINIPFSFSDVRYFDSLLNIYDQDIISHKNLIIDLRDNAGGSVNMFKKLRKYFYTNPIHSDNYEYFSSKKNIQKLENIFITIADSNSSRYFWYNSMIQKMKDNFNNFVIDSGSVYKQDSIYLFPKNVAILINEYTASASELFLLEAMQSTKVNLFGNKNTMGASDKVDAHLFDIEECNYSISIPICERMKNVYKNIVDFIGISPQIKLRKNQDPYKQIIEFYE